jgi:hypothetical protein
MCKDAKTIVFWGAGATASLGLRTTPDQAIAVRHLANADAHRSLFDRVAAARGKSDSWIEPLADLLLVLGDAETNSIHHISSDAREAMGRHWSESSHESLDERVHHLRALYDWPALKAVVCACPGFNDGVRFQLADVFNMIDLNVQGFNGFPVAGQFLSPDRLVAARRALQLLLNTLFFVDWQTALSNKVPELEKHLGFARLLTEHHQEQGLTLATGRQHFDTREFYLGDIAFASLNYDPVALWAQFIANRDANLAPPYIDVPRVPLKMFHDFGIFMAVSTIGHNTGDDGRKERVWYPLNEASAQRLNDRDHSSRRVRINKFLFPHGCLCWRECPSCGKLTAYMGKKWEFFSRALIPPPPLRGFVEQARLTDDMQAESDKEQEAWNQGKVDARTCVHCEEMTYAQHTQAVMQSNFKQTPPSFIEEVQRDLRVVVQSATHIILMGYSLPPDDVTYRAFFAARKHRGNDSSPDSAMATVRCSVVVGKDYGDQWHGPTGIDTLLNSPDNLKPGETPRTTLEAARDIFGRENVRFFGGGIPKVFCDGEKASQARFEQLINWRTEG